MTSVFGEWFITLNHLGEASKAATQPFASILEEVILNRGEKSNSTPGVRRAEPS